MFPRERASRSLLALLALSAILTGLLAAGCGGGDQSGNQSGNQSEGQRGDQQGGQQGDQGNNAEPANSKIALGTIRAVNEEKMRVSLKPTSEDAEPMDFKVRQNAEISLSGENQEIGEIQGGQQAQIEYVEKGKGPNRAVSVELFPLPQRQSEDGQPQEDGQTN